MQLILASTSKYRRELLARLAMPFDTRKPDFDEDSFKSSGRSPIELAEFLAKGKAESILKPGVCVIGADQLVALDGDILGKPKTKDAAVEMLIRMSGKTHELITAVYVATSEKSWKILDRTQLTMRRLHREQIENYVRIEKPLDCAGAYKIEGLGITLFEKIDSHDFTAIQGLPLIALTTVLNEAGLRR